MEPVKTEAGYVTGAVIGQPGKEVRIYRGIPYAAPPVADLRWKPPQPAASWTGIRECTVFADSCPQLPVDWEGFDFPQSEDCLSLNILTPAETANDKLPVMVSMHGGGYMVGSSNDMLYNMPKLPQHGVVLVPVNARIGVLGLMAHPLLSGESPKGVSGNYMILDMIAALQWIQRNIAAFGGNPDNVTIFGESGGSWKVIDLLISPLAKGLFHKVICESGTPWGTNLARPLTLKETEARGDNLFARLGVNREKDPLAAARALPWEKLLQAEAAMMEEAGIVNPVCIWDISIDSWVLPDTPANVFKAGKQNTASFVVGGNLGEIINPGTPIMPEVIPAYMEMLSSANRAKIKAYAYIFDHVPSKWKEEGCVCAHGQEVPYVFGELDRVNCMWDVAQMLNGAKSPDPGITGVDEELSELMMTMWTQFAKTGNPSVKGQITWPAYEVSTDQYLYIDDPMQVKSGFSQICPYKEGNTK